MRTKQGLEPYRVLHNDRMAQLVDDDIINHKLRSLDDSPIDGNVLFYGAIAPFFLWASDVKPMIRQQQRFR